MPSKLDYLSKYTSEPISTTSKKEKKPNKRDKKKKKKSKRKRGDDTAKIYDDEDPTFDRKKNSNDEESSSNGGDVDDEDRPLVVASEDLPVDQQQQGGAIVSHAPRGTWESTDAPGGDGSPSQSHHRRRRHDSDDDRSDEEESPGPRRRRRRRHDSEDDDSSSVEEDRRPRRRRHDSDDDDSSEDNNQDRSPPRQQRRRYDSDDDDSSDNHRRQRRRYDSSSSDDNDDKGSKKTAVKEEDNDRDKRRQRPRADSDSSDDDSRERMASGHKAGLQHYSDFNAAESKLQQQKHKDAQQMVDKYGMGETVYRDAQGKATDSRPDKKVVLSEEEQRALNVGRVQREREQAQAAELQRLSESTFARHRDDDQLEAELKEEIRKDDPMAQYAIKKQASKRKAAGIEDTRPVYKGPPPKPNRFGIRPGYRWDGVDRGNGWEDKLLAKQYSVAQRKEQAYKWSSADM